MTDILTLFKRITAVILTIIALISPDFFKLLTGTSEYGEYVLFYTDTYPDDLTELLLSNENNLFENSTAAIAKKLVTAVIIQFMTGEMDNGEAADILDEIPFGDIERDSNDVEVVNTLSKVLAGALKDSDVLPSNIKSFLNTWSEGINDLYVYFRNTEYEGIYEFMGSYLNDKGELKTVVTGVYYDTATDMVYGKDNNGIFGIGYDCNVYDMVLTVPSGAWMKSMGYNFGYDILGSLIFMHCETQRVRFEYAGTQWMVQLWKGNYTRYANGAEIGLYYLADGEWFQYSCVDGDNMIAMSMELYGNDKLILSEKADRHWWICGFQPVVAIDASDMTLKANITFNYEEMARLFAEKAAKDMTASYDGKTVSITWS